MKRKAIIEVLPGTTSKTLPISATFTNEPPNPSALVFGAFSQRSGGSQDKKKRRMVMCLKGGNSDKVAYRSEVDDEGEESFSRYVVGVFDPASKKVVLAPASAAIRIIARPRMLGNAESKVISQKNASAVINLGETFGTVKKKKQIKEVERNKVSADSLAAVDNILMKQIDSTPGETKDERVVATDVNRPIPPFNREAKSPEDVYNIEDIAPSTDLRQVPVKQLAKAKFAAGIKEILPDVTGWVLNRLEACLTGGGETERVQHLVYLSYMIRFFKATEHVLNKRDQAQKYFEHVPAAILETFTQKFTEQLVEQTRKSTTFTRYKIPERVHDKLMAYILALALKIEGYKMDVNGMAAVLGVPVTKVGSMCRELGCRVESVKADGGTERKAVLSVPLKFPTRSLY